MGKIGGGTKGQMIQVLVLVLFNIGLSLGFHIPFALCSTTADARVKLWLLIAGKLAGLISPVVGLVCTTVCPEMVERCTLGAKWLDQGDHVVEVEAEPIRTARAAKRAAFWGKARAFFGISRPAEEIPAYCGPRSGYTQVSPSPATSSLLHHGASL